MNAYSLQEKKTKHCRYPNVTLASCIWVVIPAYDKLNTMGAVGYDEDLESFLDEGLGAEDARGVRKAKPIIPLMWCQYGNMGTVGSLAQRQGV